MSDAINAPPSPHRHNPYIQPSYSTVKLSLLLHHIYCVPALRLRPRGIRCYSFTVYSIWIYKAMLSTRRVLNP